MATTRTKLTISMILKWADAHRRRTGRWPTKHAGEIPKANGLRWDHVQEAFRRGYHGLPSGTSLRKVLVQHRGLEEPLLDWTEPQVWAWITAFHQRHGRWPSRGDGRIPGGYGESWATVEAALRRGTGRLQICPTIRTFIKRRLAQARPVTKNSKESRQKGRRRAHPPRTKSGSRGRRPRARASSARPK